MPYKRVGRRIYKLVGGRWVLRSTCKNVENAKRQLRLLNAIEHGWKPTRKRKKSRKRKKKR